MSEFLRLGGDIDQAADMCRGLGRHLGELFDEQELDPDKLEAADDALMDMMDEVDNVQDRTQKPAGRFTLLLSKRYIQSALTYSTNVSASLPHLLYTWVPVVSDRHPELHQQSVGLSTSMAARYSPEFTNSQKTTKTQQRAPKTDARNRASL